MLSRLNVCLRKQVISHSFIRWFANLALCIALIACKATSNDSEVNQTGSSSNSYGLSVVVPVYRELDNGNVFLLLDSFTKQTAGSAAFDLFFVVNNTPEVAQSSHDPTYLENQDTLQLLRFAAGEELSSSRYDSLAPWQKRILTEARSASLNIHVVDLSTHGVNRCIGAIRGRGIEEAIEKYDGVDRIVANFDADTNVEDDYVERILKHMQDATTDALFLNLAYRIGSETNHLALKTSHRDQQYKIAWQNFMQVLAPVPSSVGGPQSVFRQSVYRKAGGMPIQDMAEDFEFAKRLVNSGRVRFAPDVTVTTADRIREVGYDSAQRQYRVDALESGDQELSDNASFNNLERVLLGRFIDAVYSKQATVLPEHLDAIFTRFGVPFNDVQWQAAVERYKASFRQGRGNPDEWKKYVSLALGDYIENTSPNRAVRNPADTMTDLLRSSLAPSEYDAFNAILTQSIELDSSRFADLQTAAERIIADLLASPGAAQNSLGDIPPDAHTQWLAEYLNLTMASYHFSTAEQFRTYLVTEYPDVFLPIDKSLVRMTIVRMQALTRFIETVRNSPQRYPSAARLIQEIIDAEKG